MTHDIRERFTKKFGDMLEISGNGHQYFKHTKLKTSDLISYISSEVEAERERVWTWAVDNGITDKKSFVALRDFLGKGPDKEKSL